MPSNHELLARITARPDVFGGKPIIRDMRISVEMILSLLTQGVSLEGKHDPKNLATRTTADSLILPFINILADQS